MSAIAVGSTTPVEAQPAASVASEPSSNAASAPTPAPSPEETKSTEQPSSDVADFGKRLGVVAKRERALQAKEKELKAKQAEFEVWQKRQELKKKNPLAFLKEEGLDYNALTEAVLNHKGEEEPEVDPIKERLEKLEKERTDEQNAKLQSALDQLKTNIKETAEKDPENFELVGIYGAYDLAYQVIETHHAKTLAETGKGEVLKVEDALKAVEDYLFQEVTKASKAKKLAPKPAEPKSDPAPEAEVKPTELQKPKEGPSSLSNRLSGTSSQPVKTRKSDAERLKEAAALLDFSNK